jgi:glycosyltransferase involved in cell wall biosynthesis
MQGPVRANHEPQPGAPVVSVILPTYNRARFLPQALEGILAQRDCPPFEVVVVDDGSTDNTVAVVRSHQGPVRLLILERNRGLAAARQAGVQEARGTLLAFHDSDDLMLPGRLGLLASYLERHPEVGTVFASGEVESVDGTIGGRVVPASLALRLHGRTVSVRDIVRGGLPIYLQAALVRRRVFEAAGGIDVDLDWHADMELGCRLALQAPAVFLDLPVFRYRLHAENITRDRLRLREGFATVLRRIRERNPEAVHMLGARWLRRREARHLYRLSRERWRRGERDPARAAIRRAIDLRPWSLPLRWLSWQMSRQAP